MPFPLDVRFVKQAEQKLARKLPLGYIARMCHNNGGEVRIEQDVFQLHPIMDDTDRKRLARTCNDVIHETATARGWTNFPPDALAIGDNGGGDKLVILPETDALRYGEAIYWWDHETGELHFVADAIGELE